MATYEAAHLKTGQWPTAVLKGGRTTILSPLNRPQMLMEDRIVPCGLRQPLNSPLLEVGSVNASGPSGTYYVCYRWKRQHGHIYSNPSPLGRQSDRTPHISVNGKSINVTISEHPREGCDFWEVLVMEAQESLWHVVGEVETGTTTFSITLDNLTLQTRPPVFVLTGASMDVLDNHVPPSCEYGAVWLNRLWLAGMQNTTLDAVSGGTFRLGNQWFERDPMDEGASVIVAQDLPLSSKDPDETDDDDTQVYYLKNGALEARSGDYYVDNGVNSYTFNVVAPPGNSGIAVNDVLDLLDSEGALVEANSEAMTVTAVSNVAGAETITVAAAGALSTAVDSSDWVGAFFDADSYTFYPARTPGSADIGVGNTIDILTSNLAPVETNSAGTTVLWTSNDIDAPAISVSTIDALVADADSEDWNDCGFSKAPSPPGKQIRGVLTLYPVDDNGFFDGGEAYRDLQIDGSTRVYPVDETLDYRRLRLFEKYRDSRDSLELALETRNHGGEDVYFINNGNGLYTFYVSTSPTAAGVVAGLTVDVATVETDEGVFVVAVEQAVANGVVTAVGDGSGIEYVTIQFPFVGDVWIEADPTDADIWGDAGIAISETAKTGQLNGKPWVFSTRLDADGFNDEAVPPLNFEFPAALKGHMPNGIASSGGALVVFTENEIAIGRGQAGLGRPLVAWDEEPLAVGLAAPRTLVEVPKEHGVVAKGDLLFIGPGGKLLRYSYGTVYDVGRRLNVHEYLASVTDASWADAVGEWDPSHGWYVVSNFNPSGDSGNYSYRFCWDTFHDAFFIFKECPATAFGAVQDSNGKDQVIFGDDYGFVGVDHLDGVNHRDRQLESERQAGATVDWVSWYVLASDTINANGLELASGVSGRPLDWPTDGDGLKGAYLLHHVRVTAAHSNIYAHRILSNTAGTITLEENWTANSKPLPVVGDIFHVGGVHMRWTSGIVGADSWGEKQLRSFAVRGSDLTGGGFLMRFSFWVSDGERDTAVIFASTRHDSDFDKPTMLTRGKLLDGAIASDFVFSIEGVVPDLIITQIQIILDQIRGELT